MKKFFIIKERTNSNWLSFRLHFNKSETFDWIVILKRTTCYIDSINNTPTYNNQIVERKTKKRNEIRRAWLMMYTSHIWVCACVCLALVKITIRRCVQEQKQIRFFGDFSVCVCDVCMLFRSLALFSWMNFFEDSLRFHQVVNDVSGLKFYTANNIFAFIQVWVNEWVYNSHIEYEIKMIKSHFLSFYIVFFSSAIESVEKMCDFLI